MNTFEIVEHTLYEKAFKKLSKKFKTIDKDIDTFLLSVNNKDDLGVELKSNIFKVRIANSSKNKGKSAGYRLLTYVALVKNELHLLYIYDKSSIGNLTESEVDAMISNALVGK
jgi:mRNA-degrading endonuclease RelE of RelBE toxin-antitoxin system